MTPRQRFIQTLTFGRPDRVPFEPGWPRESTLAAWHTQGLPPDVPWQEHLASTLGITLPRTQPHVDLGVDFRLIPQFEEKVIERRDGHLIVQDYKGNVCEISDRYDLSYLRQAKDFVTRRWLRCPVENRTDWERLRLRYDAHGAGRFPEDFSARCAQAATRDWPLVVAFNGPFWQLREWCGLEGLCLLMIDQPDFVDEMAEYWETFVAAVLRQILVRVTPDMVHISEDMAYKAHAMISPAMIRRFCMTRWDRWVRMARAAGVPLVGVDSDGFIGELLPLWIEAGVNVTDPVEVAAHNDLPAYRARYGKAMAYRGGVDKRAMAAGGDAIRAELARLAPVVEQGGYIPGCDHGVPPDVSWPNFVDYARLLAEMTGWA
jgi:uroporphyrinogen decarboxylase